MSEVTTPVEVEQKAASAANTALRNAMHTSRKKYRMKAVITVVLIPLLYMSAVWLNGWLNTPSVPKVSESAAQAAADEVHETPPASQATSDMQYLTVAKGECTEAIVVPQGQNADYWFLEGTLKVQFRPSRNAEWTESLVGSASQIRFCGDGKVSYQLRPS